MNMMPYCSKTYIVHIKCALNGHDCVGFTFSVTGNFVVKTKKNQIFNFREVQM